MRLAAEEIAGPTYLAAGATCELHQSHRHRRVDLTPAAPMGDSATNTLPRTRLQLRGQQQVPAHPWDAANTNR
ncbi:hypothetical protein GCM10010521_37770 [Streptomyces rameus]|uniref:Uncharacterized protein n=1 Tax=Streptomyces rameus TaxID=68261 RepID=A0ABP6NG26_9ACTN